MTPNARSAQKILDFWFGDNAHDAAAAAENNKRWFAKSDVLDREIADTFGSIVARLAGGGALIWADESPRHRLAAIIALDQFSRNMFRGTPAAFENDPLARRICVEGLNAGDDLSLSIAERIFFYLPLEHSENDADQARCVALFENLRENAPEDWRSGVEHSLDYARRHQEIIRKFGRFPHRNAILGRETSQAEADFVTQPGSSF